jgi:hypothetical protein
LEAEDLKDLEEDLEEDLGILFGRKKEMFRFSRIWTQEPIFVGNGRL